MVADGLRTIRFNSRSEALEDVPVHLDRGGGSALLSVVLGHVFRPQAGLETELFVEAENCVVVVRIDDDQSRSRQARCIENVTEEECHQGAAHSPALQILMDRKSPDLDGGKGSKFDVLTEPQFELLGVVELDRVVGEREVADWLLN